MITADELLGLAGCATEVIDLPGHGKVRARPLSTAQALAVGREDDNEERAALTLHHGLVDPEITVDQARELIRSAPFGPVNIITQEVLRLSGMTEEAQKSGGESVPDGGG